MHSLAGKFIKFFFYTGRGTFEVEHMLARFLKLFFDIFYYKYIELVNTKRDRSLIYHVTYVYCTYCLLNEYI